MAILVQSVSFDVEEALKRSARKNARLSRARGPAHLGKTKAHGCPAAAEPQEEVFREMLLAGFDAIRGMEIDDVYPANQTDVDEVYR
jgi:hypothetical protein